MGQGDELAHRPNQPHQRLLAARRVAKNAVKQHFELLENKKLNEMKAESLK